MRALAAILLPLVPAALAQDPRGEPFAVEPLHPDPARDARIAQLIDDLREVALPYDGITCTSGGGVGFDAIGDREDTPPAFRELVRLGPAAMPALLRHLDDKRETKLSFRWVHEDMGSRMFFRPEIAAGGPEERVRIRRVLGAKAEKDGPVRSELGKSIEGHTVTVGDCCFVILGQIVNRSYEAVRYQPSLLAIVSSPTREPRIAKVLRGRWGRADPRLLLAESLRDDIHNGRDGWRGAAERLRFYFPEEGDPFVAKVSALHWGDPDEQWGRDGVDGVEFLREAMRAGHPLVRAEWLKLLDPDRPVQAQLAALAAAPDDPGDDARERIRVLRDHPADLDVVALSIAALPGEKSPVAFAWLKGEFARVEKRDAGQTQLVLAALAALDEEESRPIFLAHIEKLTNFGWGNALVALGRAPRPRLATALFGSRLDMTGLILPPRPVPSPGWMTDETRWCDLAAKVLADARPDLTFDPKAPLEERDGQIAAMRVALAK